MLQEKSHKQSALSDSQLVTLALKKQDAFEELVNRYESKLFRYVLRFSGLTDQCAEDILQEVFVKIYRNLNDFDPSLKFSSWAYRITRNETINYIRKNKKNKNLSLQTDDEDTANLIDFLKSEDDIPEEIAKKELSAEVHEVLSRLPEKYKEVLVLRYLEELDYSEISDILKKPMGTVATLLNRAKSQFKTLAAHD
jgi:RNA polymerase sigma-70 factor, ECF subfamily